LGNIYLILRNPFYYGSFQYPKNSGRWYVGKHQPIIIKELFDAAQEQLGQRHIVKSESKEFAFTRLITCALCGSGVTAQEKMKQYKNGTTGRFVYYGCCRAKDITCKSGYISEHNLIEELLNLIDSSDIDELGIKKKLAEEIDRHNKFQQGILGGQKMVAIKDVQLKNYMKYILQNGTLYEKRNILSCLKSRLKLANKKLNLV
jgi:hypothetical protein